jgi:excisionase family DNA binding protein
MTAKEPRPTQQRGDSEILTTDEAAQVLRISKRLLLRLVREGQLPGRKLGREWRFLRSDLRRAITPSQNGEDDLIRALQSKRVAFTVTPRKKGSSS